MQVWPAEPRGQCGRRGWLWALHSVGGGKGARPTRPPKLCCSSGSKRPLPHAASTFHTNDVDTGNEQVWLLPTAPPLSRGCTREGHAQGRLTVWRVDRRPGGVHPTHAPAAAGPHRSAGLAAPPSPATSRTFCARLHLSTGFLAVGPGGRAAAPWSWGRSGVLFSVALPHLATGNQRVCDTFY